MELMEKLIEKHGGKIKELLRQPVFFIENIMGLILTDYQKEWLDIVEKNDRVNLTAFRQSGKTEVMFVCYPIFRAFTQPGFIAVIVSSSMPQAVEILRRIRDRILDSDVLRTSVPSTKTADWSKTQIELKNKSRIILKACNPNIRGHYADYVGGDEIGEWKDMDIITKTLPPLVLARKGKMCFIGTPTSHIDPIHQLQQNKAFLSKVYPANLKVGDQTLWEMRYPDTSIQSVRREYDSLSWSREFLCKPLSDEDKIFPFSLIQPCLDYETNMTIKRKEHCAYYFGLDFALSAESQADFSVFIVLEAPAGEEQVRLVAMERYKGLSFQAQKLRIKQLADIFRPTRVVADEGSFGKSFIQDLQADHVPVTGFKFTQQSKQDLISNLRNFFERVKLIINYNREDMNTKLKVEQILKELDSFGIKFNPQTKTIKFEALGGHDDITMALCLAAWAARGAGSMSWNVHRNTPPKSSIMFMGTV